MIETDNKEVKLSSTWKPISPNNPNQTPNQWGRPSKLKDFNEALEKLLNENEEDVICLTDEEIRFVCNDMLEEKARISDTTFEKRKKWDIQDSPEYQRFIRLYKKALVNQKRELFKLVRAWENWWQSKSWIIERKFKEWNLKTISENKTEHSGTLSISNVLNELWDNEIDLTK